MTRKNPLNFVALDLEVTDLIPVRAGIIEVGLVRFEDGVAAEQWSSLADPGHPIPPIVTSITGIVDADVRGKPTFADLQDQVRNFVGDLPVVGHNINFDLDHLAQHGLDLRTGDRPIFDTWQLATLLLQEYRSYSLETLARGFQLTHNDAHRAQDDARVAGELFVKLVRRMQTLPPKLLQEISEAIFRQTYSLASIFSFAETHALPHESIDEAGRKIKGTRSSHRDVRPREGLPGELADIVAATGPLASAVSAYEFRPIQLRYMEAVDDVLERDASLIIESPQGIGRRLGYMLPIGLHIDPARPVFIALPNEGRIQTLLSEEWPVLEDVLGLDDSNITQLDDADGYFCPAKFSLFSRRQKLTEDEVNVLVKVLIWRSRSTTGRLKELVLQPQERPLLRHLRCRSHAHGEHDCDRSCPWHESLDRAKRTPIVLITHSQIQPILGGNAIKPRMLLIDEARSLITRLDRIEKLSLQSIMFRLLDLAPAFPRQGIIDLLSGEITDVRERVIALQTQLTLIEGLLGIVISKHGVREDDGARLVNDAALSTTMEWLQVERGLQHFISQWEDVNSALLKLPLETGMHIVISELEDEIQQLAKAVGPNSKSEFILTDDHIWVERMVEDALVFGKLPVSQLVITDRVLRVSGSYQYVRTKLGLPENLDEITLPDHLPFESSVLIGVPSQLPGVTAPAFTDVAEDIIRRLGKLASDSKKMLVLSSSQAQVMPLFHALESEHPSMLAQGVGGGKGKMLDAMRHDPYDILLGTFRTWKDTDFPHRFSIIVVLKLPFDPPTGKEVDFMGETIPEMSLAIRDIFRHLLRSSDEKGSIVLIDPRLEGKGYGHVILHSLPKAPLVMDRPDRMIEAIAGHLES